MERVANRKYSLFVVREYIGTAFVHYYYQLEMNIVIDVYTRETLAPIMQFRFVFLYFIRHCKQRESLGLGT